MDQCHWFSGVSVFLGILRISNDCENTEYKTISDLKCPFQSLLVAAVLAGAAVVDGLPCPSVVAGLPPHCRCLPPTATAMTGALVAAIFCPSALAASAAYRRRREIRLSRQLSPPSDWATGSQKPRIIGWRDVELPPWREIAALARVTWVAGERREPLTATTAAASGSFPLSTDSDHHPRRRSVAAAAAVEHRPLQGLWSRWEVSGRQGWRSR